MEEDIKVLPHINSAHGNLVLQNSTTCWDRKRKLQAEHLDIPPSKHACADRSCGSSIATQHTDVFFRNISVGDTDGMVKADPETESAEDSNSTAADAESFMCTSGGATETDDAPCKEYVSDERSTLSSDWTSKCSSSGTYSLESRSLTQLISKRPESAVYDADATDHELGFISPLDIEGHILQCEGHMDASCSEHNASVEECRNDDLDELLNSDPNSFLLSSGRWIVKPDTKQIEKKKTIDKEFEEYFSGLML